MIDIAASPAIEALWRSHADELVRFATMLVGPSDASDIVVDSFLAAAPIAAGPTVSNARAYLYRAVSNQAQRQRRSSERRWIRDLAAIGAEVTIAADSLIDVRRAVTSLSLDQRTIVYLAYWEDMRERDIAGLLDLSPATVHRRLAHAKLRLRKALI